MNKYAKPVEEETLYMIDPVDGGPLSDDPISIEKGVVRGKNVEGVTIDDCFYPIFRDNSSVIKSEDEVAKSNRNQYTPFLYAEVAVQRKQIGR